MLDRDNQNLRVHSGSISHPGLGQLRRDGQIINGLRPWRVVAREYAARTGEELTSARVQQICRVAERKLRRRLESEAALEAKWAAVATGLCREKGKCTA